MQKLVYSLFVMLLISSCSMSKRYHNSGWSVDWAIFHKKDKSEKSTTSKTSKNNTKNYTTNTNNKGITIYRNIENAHLPCKVLIQNAAISKSEILNSKSDAEYTPIAISKIQSNNKIQKLKHVLQSKNTIKSFLKNKDTSDHSLLVQIILLLLCLFICPLGYILVTGTADKWFWICLITYLLGGGIILNLATSIGSTLAFLSILISVIIALFAFLGWIE